ncbi:MAG TPA: flagellar hook-basal body complex protein FliE [Rhizomicrobium sp.]|nr:flagellar hook-basal body complex protein FliE [Rhizomicrobium sp.]
MAIPAAAAAAYKAAASITAPSVGGASSIAPANVSGPGSFSDFLSGAVKDSIQTIANGEQAAQAQVAGKSNIVDVVNAVNSAELTLNTVVAVRDKVVQAYQSILNMPI